LFEEGKAAVRNSAVGLKDTADLQAKASMLVERKRAVAVRILAADLRPAQGD
jgi:hypothetical protein